MRPRVDIPNFSLPDFPPSSSSTIFSRRELALYHCARQVSQLFSLSPRYPESYFPPSIPSATRLPRRCGAHRVTTAPRSQNKLRIPFKPIHHLLKVYEEPQDLC